MQPWLSQTHIVDQAGPEVIEICLGWGILQDTNMEVVTGDIKLHELEYLPYLFFSVTFHVFCTFWVVIADSYSAEI